MEGTGDKYEGRIGLRIDKGRKGRYMGGTDKIENLNGKGKERIVGPSKVH